MKQAVKIISYSVLSFLILSPFLSLSYLHFQNKSTLWMATIEESFPGISKIEFYSDRVFSLIEQTINVGALYEAAINPNTKYVAIVEGMRKEEIANVYQKALGWNDNEKEEFANTLGCYPENEEGYFYPSVYVVSKDATPEEIMETMKDKFDQMVSSSTSASISPIVNVDMVVRIASIIQREAAGKTDARLVSGVIWNRIFNGMKLDMDATLQYAKGNEEKWWPRVKSEDKYIESPYNTYMYKGLPPTAISNPGIWAIQAAINPQKTECFFYIHDSKRKIHCAKTYEQHKRNINLYLK